MVATLVQTDVDLFYKLYLRLLLFVNEETGTLKHKNLSHDAFMALPMNERMKVREAFCNRKEFIDQFIESNHSKSLNADELAIVKSWKHFEKGEFFIYKHLKKYSIFLSESGKEKAYAVSGIFDPLCEMFPNPPTFVETILLPFKDRIIYDGCCMGYSIYFGSGIRAGLKRAYEKAKHHYGLITQLPMETCVNINSDIDNLKFYMKNESNREQYWDKIVSLSGKSTELNNLYYQEMGRIHSRYFSKQLKRLGLLNKWFAMLDNTVVASGLTKDKAYKNVANIVPKKNLERVYFFKT